MAAQDFRHATQEDQEKVIDFIRLLERLFKLPYGRDGISAETRNTLLYGQLQEGLKHKIMESPAVSGATGYQKLCLAAKAEEKRLAETKKQRQYQSEQKPKQTSSARPEGSKHRQSTGDQSEGGFGCGNSVIRCWNCQCPGHLAADCKDPKWGKSEQPARGGRAQQIHSAAHRSGGQEPQSPAKTTLMLPSHENANLPEDGCQGITSTVRGSVSPTGYHTQVKPGDTRKEEKTTREVMVPTVRVLRGRLGEAETSGECHGGG